MISGEGKKLQIVESDKMRCEVVGSGVNCGGRDGGKKGEMGATRGEQKNGTRRVDGGGGRNKMIGHCGVERTACTWKEGKAW